PMGCLGWVWLPAQGQVFRQLMPEVVTAGLDKFHDGEHQNLSTGPWRSPPSPMAATRPPQAGGAPAPAPPRWRSPLAALLGPGVGQGLELLVAKGDLRGGDVFLQMCHLRRAGDR